MNGNFHVFVCGADTVNPMPKPSTGNIPGQLGRMMDEAIVRDELNIAQGTALPQHDALHRRHAVVRAGPAMVKFVEGAERLIVTRIALLSEATTPPAIGR